MASDPQSLISDPELDALVRRVDEDRWLASRFAPADVRQRLTAIYALNYELARIAETVHEPGLGDIRLTWWRDALAEVHAGATPRAHPVLSAYARAHGQTPFTPGVVEALIEARRKDLEATPFATVAAFDDYLAATAGGVMRLGVEACGESHSRDEIDRFVFWAGWLWGCAGLLRAREFWAARGRSFISGEGGSVEALIARAESATREIRTLARPPSAAFPALGYVTLAHGYLSAVKSGRRSAPLLARQVRLIAASATGRI
jgi:phytoene synthase